MSQTSEYNKGFETSDSGVCATGKFIVNNTDAGILPDEGSNATKREIPVLGGMTPVDLSITNPRNYSK